MTLSLAVRLLTVTKPKEGEQSTMMKSYISRKGSNFDGPGFVIGARQGAGGVELMMWRAKPWLLWAA
jgi:hypothetical protein